MMQPTFEAWLNRVPAGPKPKRPLHRRTPERAKQERQYNKRVKEYLLEHPIDAVWLKENGWIESVEAFGDGQTWYLSFSLKLTVRAEYLEFRHSAARSTQVHHMNKRRGKMLLDERYWLAVSGPTHERIEQNKQWARDNGYLLNF